VGLRLNGEVKTIADHGQQLHVEAIGEHRGERLGHVGYELVFAANRLDAGQAAYHLNLRLFETGR
jgi:hypothetical protein